MTGFIYRATFAFSVLVFATQTYAQILAEPYIGYMTGDSKRSGAQSFKVDGPVYGARLGYVATEWSFGAEYMGAMFGDDISSENEWTSGNLGVFVGYAASEMFRLYLTYFLSSDWEADDGSDKFDYTDGNQIKVGASYTGFSSVYVNFEYMMTTFSKVNGAKQPSDRKMNVYGITLSMPFTF